MTTVLEKYLKAGKILMFRSHFKASNGETQCTRSESILDKSVKTEV